MKEITKQEEMIKFLSYEAIVCAEGDFTIWVDLMKCIEFIDEKRLKKDKEDIFDFINRFENDFIAYCNLKNHSISNGKELLKYERIFVRYHYKNYLDIDLENDNIDFLSSKMRIGDFDSDNVRRKEIHKRVEYVFLFLLIAFLNYKKRII